MTIQAQLADGRVLEFPDGTNPAVIQQTIKSMLAQEPAPAEVTPEVAPAAPQAAPTAPFGAMAPVAPQAIPEEQAVAMGAPEEPTAIEEAVAPVAEFAAGANQAIIDLIDFLGPEQVNNILQLAGSQQRVPTLGETELAREVAAGGFVEGRPGEVIRAAGRAVPAAVGIGAGIRQAAAQLPRVAPSAEPLTAGVTRQLAAGTTPTLEAITAAGAGAGAELGEEFGTTGEIIGGITGALTAVGIKNTLAATPGAIKSVFTSAMREAGDEKGAAKLLAEQMVREGLSPDDVARRLEQLGPEAIPADAASSFARVLRTASNEIPKIEGRAATLFRERQVQQAGRLAQAFDEVGGTVGVTSDDAIRALDEQFKPEINRLYSAARQKAVQLSPTVRNILEKPGLGRDARRAAEKVLQTRRTLGDKISNIDIIDATKQKLDDKISSAIKGGERQLARDLVRVKNALVEEADAAIPEYAQARNLFAGKAQMESASELGEQFFKLKPREIENMVRTMGDAEKRMFQLGAKNAVLDRMEDIQTNANLAARLFGKRGDIRKLSAVFDDERALNNFSDTLEREAQFVLTRRAAEANSTTVRQATDADTLKNMFENVVDATASPTGAASALRRIIGGLGQKKTSEEFIKALSDAGDILLDQGADPKRIAALLKRGRADVVERELRKALKSPKPSRIAIPTAVGIAQQEQQ